MVIGSDVIRGHTETIMLGILIEKDNYGYEISKAISQRSGGLIDVKDATIYTAFRRMEETGLITSYWGDGEAGARRKYYSVTRKGRDVYFEKVDEWKKTVEVLNNLIIGGKKG